MSEGWTQESRRVMPVTVGREVKKPWGTTTLLYLERQLAIVKIVVLPGGYSSRHYHRHNLNHFLVLEGELRVNDKFDVSHDPYFFGVNSTKESVDLNNRLRAGDTKTYWPCEPHRFYSPSGCVAIETYSTSGPQIDLEDIVRSSENGLDQ